MAIRLLRTNGMHLEKVDVAQWVDRLAVLYSNIRLRHQRNKTTVAGSSFTSPNKLQR
jgi:hypothetical protein